MIVLNAEPLHYSKKAVFSWLTMGYTYESTSWEEIDNRSSWPNVEILIVRLAKKVDKNILNKFPDLKTVLSATTGHDHLDLASMSKSGIRLVSLREEKEFLKSIPSTAEHTWALLMALARNIPAANEHVKEGKWNRDAFRGKQLQGKTLGIIGLGRTGLLVAQYATTFKMKVIYYDPNVLDTKHERKADIKSIFADSDFVTVHVHLSPETRFLINSDVLNASKQGLCLINTSRGLLIDEDEVVKMLKDNRMDGIATDVIIPEMENIRDSRLWQAQQAGFNVIITPHIGGATIDAMTACEEYLANQYLYEQNN